MIIPIHDFDNISGGMSSIGLMRERLTQWIGRLSRRRRDQPLYLFCYHKVGTVLLTRVVEKVSNSLGWSWKVVLGHPDVIPDSDVVIFAHSRPGPAAIQTPFVGAHFIRDPRDVIVSGYLYHRRCSERWCVNEDLDPTEPITFPKVPHSQKHRPEAWKRAYLDSLGGKSYQKNLLDLPEDEGLQFEMDRYGGWTTTAMAEWEGDSRILEVRFEDVMADFDHSFKRIFTHAGLQGEELSDALALAATEDLSRKSAAAIDADAHVTSRSTTRWPKYFKSAHKKAFAARWPGLLERLGYHEATPDSW